MTSYEMASVVLDHWDAMCELYEAIALGFDQEVDGDNHPARLKMDALWEKMVQVDKDVSYRMRKSEGTLQGLLQIWEGRGKEGVVGEQLV